MQVIVTLKLNKNKIHLRAFGGVKSNKISSNVVSPHPNNIMNRFYEGMKLCAKKFDLKNSLKDFTQQRECLLRANVVWSGCIDYEPQSATFCQIKMNCSWLF